MSRVSAGSRLRRVLAVLPWIIAQGPDGAPIDDVCRRFGLTRAQLTSDLERVWMVGLYPYTPDRMIDVEIEGDRVAVRLAEYFSRPLRLTPDEALALVATGTSLALVPGADPEGPLARGVAKLAAALGVDAGRLQVDLGEASSTVLDVLQEGVAAHRRVEIDHYAYGRDERALRRVDPYRVYAERGAWYLAGFDHDRQGERVFRVDRIEGATLLDERFEAPAEEALGARPPFQAGPEVPRVVLDLAPPARWVVEQYPVDEVTERDGGGVRVTVAVSGRPWLERLLVGLGPDAEVVEAPPELAGAGASAAGRILARYR